MIRFHTALEDLMVSPNTVTPDPRNANRGDVDEIIASVLRNGVYRPIYASKETGRIIAGHHLYDALLELGVQRIPVMWVDGNDTDAVRIMLADNRIAALAKTDEALLLDLLQTVTLEGQGLSGTGYDDRYLTDLLERINNETPLHIHLDEDLDHHITCPNCGASWVRGKEDAWPSTSTPG